MCADLFAGDAVNCSHFRKATTKPRNTDKWDLSGRRLPQLHHGSCYCRRIKRVQASYWYAPGICRLYSVNLLHSIPLNKLIVIKRECLLTFLLNDSKQFLTVSSLFRSYNTSCRGPVVIYDFQLSCYYLICFGFITMLETNLSMSDNQNRFKILKRLCQYISNMNLKKKIIFLERICQKESCRRNRSVVYILTKHPQLLSKLKALKDSEYHLKISN